MIYIKASCRPCHTLDESLVYSLPNVQNALWSSVLFEQHFYNSQFDASVSIIQNVFQIEKTGSAAEEELAKCSLINAVLTQIHTTNHSPFIILPSGCCFTQVLIISGKPQNSLIISIKQYDHLYTRVPTRPGKQLTSFPFIKSTWKMSSCCLGKLFQHCPISLHLRMNDQAVCRIILPSERAELRAGSY